jgi:transposase-like protein
VGSIITPPKKVWYVNSLKNSELNVHYFVTGVISYRDLVEMMDELGLKIAHSTILRWVLNYELDPKFRTSKMAKREKRLVKSR